MNIKVKLLNVLNDALTILKELASHGTSSSWEVISQFEVHICNLKQLLLHLLFKQIMLLNLSLNHLVSNCKLSHLKFEFLYVKQAHPELLHYMLTDLWFEHRLQFFNRVSIIMFELNLLEWVQYVWEDLGTFLMRLLVLSLWHFKLNC